MSKIFTFIVLNPYFKFQRDISVQFRKVSSNARETLQHVTKRIFTQLDWNKQVKKSLKTILPGGPHCSHEFGSRIGFGKEFYVPFDYDVATIESSPF